MGLFIPILSCPNRQPVTLPGQGPDTSLSPQLPFLLTAGHFSYSSLGSFVAEDAI